MSKKNFKKNSSRELAKALARLIDKKKGEDIVIFDLREISPITDYFIIASGLSNIHIKTIAEELLQQYQPDHIEGMEAATWVLIDFFDIIVHLFQPDTREFYGLERLWGDAPRVKF